MLPNEKIVEFKLNNAKFRVSELVLPAKHVRKIHTQQKVNNILVECESYERYIKEDGQSKINELTFWVEIKIFGKHKYKPRYNYEIHANINPKYNQIYDTTNSLTPIDIGSAEYETFQKFLTFMKINFEEYISNFVNLTLQMNNGKQLTNIPRFILDVAHIADLEKQSKDSTTTPTQTTW